MATVLQAMLLAPPLSAPPLADLAVELAEAYRLMAACWSREATVPDSLLILVDRLLRQVELAQMLQEKIA